MSRHQRTNRLSNETVTTLARFVAQLPIVTDEATLSRAQRVQTWDLAALTQVATLHQLSSYDAVYLRLALRTGLPLATIDAALIAAAKHAGVAVFMP